MDRPDPRARHPQPSTARDKTPSSLSIARNDLHSQVMPAEETGIKFVSFGLELTLYCLRTAPLRSLWAPPSLVRTAASQTEKALSNGPQPGLASAIALKSSGHTVIVLEKEPQLGGPDSVRYRFVSFGHYLSKEHHPCM